MLHALKYCVYGVVLGAPVGIVFHDKVGGVSEVSGRSMRPTLNPENARSCDMVWVRRRGIDKYQPQPGDIITAISPLDPTKTIIKRVVAGEGTIIKKRASYGGQCQYIRVPTGHYWIEGDNEQSSQDSNDFGPVSKGLITGRVSRIVWPPNRWQVLYNELLHHQRNRVSEQQLHDNTTTGYNERII